MFWNKKKKQEDEKMPEPTEEQLREEAEMAAREPVRRPSGETTKIVRLTLGAIDRSIQDTKTAKESALKLQESVAKAGAKLRFKKA